MEKSTVKIRIHADPQLPILALERERHVLRVLEDVCHKVATSNIS